MTPPVTELCCCCMPMNWLHSGEPQTLQMELFLLSTCFYYSTDNIFIQYISVWKLFSLENCCTLEHGQNCRGCKKTSWLNSSLPQSKKDVTLSSWGWHTILTARKKDRSQVWLGKLALMRQKSGFEWSVAPSCVDSGEKCLAFIQFSGLYFPSHTPKELLHMCSCMDFHRLERG